MPLPSDQKTSRDPIFPMQGTILVGVGGAVGASLRFIFDQGLGTWFQLPVGILLANLLGSFCLGWLVSFLAEYKTGKNENAQLILGTGLLGGFTTYSALTLDTVVLFKTGFIATAIFYSLGSVILGIFLAGLGFYLGKFSPKLGRKEE